MVLLFESQIGAHINWLSHQYVPCWNEINKGLETMELFHHLCSHMTRATIKEKVSVARLWVFQIIWHSNTTSEFILAFGMHV